MKYEFHAHYDFALQDSFTQYDAIRYLTGRTSAPPGGWIDVADIEDPWMRIAFLAQSLGTPHKEYARVGDRRDASGLKGYYSLNTFRKFLKQGAQTTMLEDLGMLPKIPDINLFPHGAFFLSFEFTLDTPYISRDDSLFSLMDNPVRKEWVFRLPYVAPSQWKGMLRSALVQELASWPTSQSLEDKKVRKDFIRQRLQLLRLFGQEKGMEDLGEEESPPKRLLDMKDMKGGIEAARICRRFLRRFFPPRGDHAGRLHFYPTFFTDIGMEVINPQVRETGAGRNPIYYECVPQGARGKFQVLYVPFNMESDLFEAAKDVRMLGKGIRSLFRIYGFGAKSSSGFGAAMNGIEGVEFGIHTPWNDLLSRVPGSSKFDELETKLSEIASLIEQKGGTR